MNHHLKSVVIHDIAHLDMAILGPKQPIEERDRPFLHSDGPLRRPSLRPRGKSLFRNVLDGSHREGRLAGQSALTVGSVKDVSKQRFSARSKGWPSERPIRMQKRTITFFYRLFGPKNRHVKVGDVVNDYTF